MGGTDALVIVLRGTAPLWLLDMTLLDLRPLLVDGTIAAVELLVVAATG